MVQRPAAAAAGDLQSRCAGDHHRFGRKKFLGGLRIGWIRASARTIASLVQARDSLDLGTPLLEQLACSWLLENDRAAPGGEPCWPHAGICAAR
jgi:hypothetical protein